MAKPLTLNDLPEDLARFAEAQITAGRFSSIEDALRGGVEALRERTQGERLALLAQAHAGGLSLEAYLQDILASAAAVKPRPEGRKSLARLFAESPLKGLNLTFARDRG